MLDGGHGADASGVAPTGTVKPRANRTKKRAPIANLPKGISVGKVTIKGKDYWRIRLGKKFTGGKPVPKHVDTLDEAKEWIFGDAGKEKAETGLSLEELRTKSGTTAFELTQARLHQAINAFKRLDAVGMSLEEAVDIALKQFKPAAGVIGLSEAISLAVERKKSKSKVYRRDLKKIGGRLARWLPKEKRDAIHLITQLDIRKFLSEQKIKVGAEKNLRKNLSAIFSWAVEFQHIAVNPCFGIKTGDAGKRKRPKILSIVGIRKLLETALKDIVQKLRAGKDEYDAIHVAPGDLIPWITLGLYAGLRPDEAKRLRWEDINFEKRRLIVREPDEERSDSIPLDPVGLHLRESDGERGRVVPMEAILIEWLRPLRPESGRGPMTKNHQWKFKALKKELGPSWKQWPQDVLRHSYASYHLARDEHAGATSFRMGHRDVNTTFQYYVDRIEEASDVDVYWSLTPEKIKELQESDPLGELTV